MTWKLVVRPRAERDIAEAIDWYNARAPGLGGEFLDAVQASVQLILQNPHQYQRLRGDLRRALVRRFPHLIIYAVERDEIIIARCLHGHRDPRQWPTRA